MTDIIGSDKHVKLNIADFRAGHWSWMGLGHSRPALCCLVLTLSYVGVVPRLNSIVVYG